MFMCNFSSMVFTRLEKEKKCVICMNRTDETWSYNFIGELFSEKSATAFYLGRRDVFRLSP